MFFVWSRPVRKRGFEHVHYELFGTVELNHVNLVEVCFIFNFYSKSLLEINNLDGITINDGESCKNGKGTDKRRIKKEMWHNGR